MAQHQLDTLQCQKQFALLEANAKSKLTKSIHVKLQTSQRSQQQNRGGVAVGGKICANPFNAQLGKDI